MNIALQSLFVALCLIGLPVICAEDAVVAASRQVPSGFWRNATTVRDVVRNGWSPATIAASPMGWVQATVVPGRESGMGEGSDAAGAKSRVPLMTFVGELKVSHRFDGAVRPAEGVSFGWEVAEDAPLGGVLTHLVFGAHQGGGLVCARIAEGATGIRVDDVILLPEGWSGADLITAVGNVAPRDGRPWGAGMAPAALLAVIRDPNPWMSIAAMRAALERTDVPLAGLLAALEQEEVPVPAVELRGMRQAVLVGMMLTHDSMATKRDAITANLGRMIGRARSPADLRGLLVAARALSYWSRGPDDRQEAMEMIHELGGMLRFRQQSPFADAEGADLLRRLANPAVSIPRRMIPDGRPDPLLVEVQRDLAAVRTVADWPRSADGLATLVVDITPDPERGGESSQRGYRQEADGTIVPLGLRVVNHVIARVKARAQVAGPPVERNGVGAKEWPESWQESRPLDSGQSSTLAMAFTIGGPAIVDFSIGQSGSARYPSLLLIPESWVAGAGEAYQTVVAHPDWFAADTALAHRADLAGLMTGANELLALRAGLMLIEHQAWEDDFADVYVLPRHGLIQAMILLRMVMHADARKLAALDAGVRAFIGRTSDPAALYGIALAAHVVQRELVTVPRAPDKEAFRLVGDAWWIELLRKKFLPNATQPRERQIVSLLHGL